jgi:peptide/nickel transport system substrate-binding protein
MAIFNNLVLFDQHEKQSRAEFIRPELADSWEWNADHTKLTFKLHQGVKWHDGQPFTAKDVKCTWDMLAGKSEQKLRLNPRHYPRVHGITTMVNSIFNGWRFEDAWMD